MLSVFCRRLLGHPVLVAGLIGLALLTVGLVGRAGRAAASGAAPCYRELPDWQTGIPPWGYHTGAPLTHGRGWFSLAYGDINLDTDRISGKICEAHYTHGRLDTLIMTPLSPMLFHTHTARKWGYPGNEIITRVRVLTSSDPACPVGTLGRLDMYASYNNVRSDSVQYTYPGSCRSEDRLFHGPQVNAQVPPA